MTNVAGVAPTAVSSREDILNETDVLAELKPKDKHNDRPF